MEPAGAGESWVQTRENRLGGRKEDKPVRKTTNMLLRDDTPWEVRRKVHQLEREQHVLYIKSLIIPDVMLALAVAFVIMCRISVG